MGLMKKLTSAIVASSLVFSMVGTAMAAYTPTAGETAGNRMMGLKILNGKYENDPLALKDEITRAELVTIIVRAFGKAEEAKAFAGYAAYPDTASHWASGNIVMAKALVERAGGDAIGMPDGTFAPDAKLTPAQAVAFLMKFLGVKADTTKAWPASYLDVAVEKNLITAEDAALLAPMSNDSATRGLVFYLFDRAFYNYDLGAGATFYTKYVDTSAPVITLNAGEATVLDSKVTITGKVEGATEVYVGSNAVTTDANGNFSFDYNLPELKDYAIVVTAQDLAGNVAEETYAVTRTTGNIATIEAEAITVAAGATVEVKAAAKDAKGNTVADAALTGESTVGTFADGKFTAATTAGTGTLTLKVGDITKEVNVTVTAGALAKVVADKPSVASGNKVTLTAQDAYGNVVTGATFTDNSDDAMTEPGTGVFVGFKTGNYTVTATKGEATASTTVGVFGAASALSVNVGGKLTANYDANDTKGSVQTVTVKVLDANGNVRSDYEGTVTLAANNAALVITGKNDETVGSETAKAGVATFEVKSPAGLAGQILTLTASTTPANANAITATGSIEIAPQVAKSVALTTDSTFVGVAADTQLGYEVKVLDQDGVKMRSGSYDATVTVAGPATVDADSTPTTTSIKVVNGTSNYLVNNVVTKVKLTSKQYTTGAVTLTATIDGLGTQSANVNAVFVGNASQVSLTSSADEYTAGGTAVTYTAKALDAQGALVDVGNNTLPANLVVDLSAMSSTDFASIAVLDTANQPIAATQGTQKFNIPVTQGANEYKFKVITTGKLTGTVKVSVTGTVGGTTTAMTSASKDLAIKAGTGTKFALASTSTKYVPVASPSTELTVQLFDSLGNAVALADKDITFTGYNGQNATADVSFDGTAQTRTYKTDANGQVKVKVAAKQYVGTTYTVSVTMTDNTYSVVANKGTVSIYVDSTATAGVALRIEKYDAVNQAWVTPSFVTAGDQIHVIATVTDTYGVGRVDNVDLAIKSTEKIFANANSTTLVAGADLTGVQWTEGTGGVYTSSAITVGKAGLVGFSVVENNAPTTVSADAQVLAYAGAATKAAVAEADSASKIYVAQNSVSSAFTLKLTDAYGNEVSTNANTTIGVAVGGAEAAKVVLLGTSSTSLGVASSFSTRGTVQFYVGVQDLTKTGTPAQITFTLGQATTTVYVVGK